MKKLSILTLIVGVFTIMFLSCKKDKHTPIETVTETEESISKLLDNYLDDQIQTFTVDASTPMVLTGDKGTQIELSGTNFIAQDGSPLTGMVKIELVELYSLTSMILTNKTTMAEQGGQIVPISSGGEFFISVTQDDETVKIDTPLNISTTPIEKRVDNMQLFKGEFNNSGDILWVLSNNNTLTPDTSNGFGFPWSGTFDWANVDYFWNSTSPQTSIKVNTPQFSNGVNTMVFSAFTTETALTSVPNISSGQFKTDNNFLVPQGLSMHTVVITIHNNQLLYAVQESTTSSNHVVNISSLTPVNSLDDLEIILNGLL